MILRPCSHQNQDIFDSRLCFGYSSDCTAKAARRLRPNDRTRVAFVHYVNTSQVANQQLVNHDTLRHDMIHKETSPTPPHCYSRLPHQPLLPLHDSTPFYSIPMKKLCIEPSCSMLKPTPCCSFLSSVPPLPMAAVGGH